MRIESAWPLLLSSAGQTQQKNIDYAIKTNKFHSFTHLIFSLAAIYLKFIRVSFKIQLMSQIYLINRLTVKYGENAGPQWFEVASETI